MDIKWKNKWVILVWLLLFSHGLNGIMLLLFHGEEYLFKNYFDTPTFQYQVDQFVDELMLLELNYIPKEETKKLITVTSEEIQEHRYRYGDLDQQLENLKGQYEPKIQLALANQNQQAVDAYKAERDRKIEDITQNFLSDEHVRVKIVKEKEEKIEKIYKELANTRLNFVHDQAHFIYHLKDKETGEVYTNVPSEGESQPSIQADQMAYMITFPSPKYGTLSSEGFADQFRTVPLVRESKVFEGQVAVPKSVKGLPEYTAFQHKQQKFYIYSISGLITFLLSLFLLKKSPIIESIAPQKWQTYYHRIPLDLAIGLLGIFGLFSLINISSNHLYRLDHVIEAASDLLISTFFIGLTIIQGKYLLARLKQTSDFKADLQQSLIMRIWHSIQQAFLVRSTGVQIFLLLMIVFGFGAGLVIALIETELLVLYVPAVLLLGLPLLFLILKKAGYFNQMIFHIQELAHGNLVPDLPVKGKSRLAKMAKNLNVLKQGVRTSKKEQAKSERLKTELISNVSHDLRTPLTSIITYTELLKTPELDVEERESYIEIIDRKSKRLKVLIDDLFEASKMASGNVELSKDKVDLVQLLQQALAEYNDQMQDSTLQFRISTPDTPVYAYVDGQKVWRVFDNLIGNILKYALEYTRVYISLKPDANQVIITFKNITKYELGESIDDLFERFKRGDTSRNTEGSGLGLAIAKSIIDLHDGSLDLEVDGDLFKVTIVFNTW